MERIPNRLLRATDAQALQALSDAAFADAELIRTTDWAQPDLWFLERSGAAISGCVAILWREVLADGVAVRIGGIASLIVTDAARGTGLGARLLARAVDEIRAMPSVSAGMLLCEARLVPFYERLGWQRVAATLRCMQRGEEVDWRGSAMLQPIVPSPLETARLVQLNGLPW